MDFVMKLISDYCITNGKHALCGLSFRITHLPIISSKEIENLNRQSLIDWKTRTEPRYREFQKERQPFELKFLSSEAVKRQKFLALNTRKLYFEKFKIFDFKRKRDSLYFEAACVCNLTHEQVSKEALKLVRAQQLKGETNLVAFN